MFAKEVSSTKARVKGKVNFSANGCFNLPNNRLLVEQEDQLAVYSVNYLKEPLAKKTFFYPSIEGISPDGSILITHYLDQDNWGLTLVSSEDLEFSSGSSFISTEECNFLLVCFIDESTFLCSASNCNKLIVKKQDNMSVSQEIDLFINEGQEIIQIEKIGKNQFVCFLKEKEKKSEYEILIFDLMVNPDQQCCIKNKKSIKLRFKTNTYSEAKMCLLANGDLLTFDKGSSEVFIWNTTTKECTKSWNWSQFKSRDEFPPLNLGIISLPDPNYLVIEVPLLSKFYLFNIENLTLKDIVFPKNVVINPNNYRLCHLLANGQLLVPGKKANETLQVDLQEMIDFRKETVERLFESFLALKQVFPSDLVNLILIEYLDFKKSLPLLQGNVNNDKDPSRECDLKPGYFPTENRSA